MQIILAHKQYRLLRSWTILSAIIVLIIFLQTMLGRFAGEPLPAWVWVMLSLLPATLVIYTGIYLGKNGTKVVHQSTFQWIYFTAILYLLLVLGTLLALPFAIINNDFTLPGYFQTSYAWLLPFQGVLILALSLLFFRKEGMPLEDTASPAVVATENLALPEAIKKNCRQHIAKNEIAEAFQQIEEHFKQEEKALPEAFVVLERRYNDVMNEKKVDTIEPQAAQRELNRIAIALLQML